MGLASNHDVADQRADRFAIVVFEGEVCFQDRPFTARADPLFLSSMSEKVVVHIAYPLWRKNALVGMARAKELMDDGDDVTVTYCDGAAGTCAVNYMGSPVTCAICRAGVRNTATELGLPLVPLSATAPQDELDELTLGEKKDLLEGVRSGLISAFRMLPRDIRANGLIQAIKHRYWQTSMALLTSIKRLLRERDVDRVEVFNGRHACSKFCLVAAKQLNIPFTTLEIAHHGRPISFPGYTPHDRIKIQERILSHDADMDLAADYFERLQTPRQNRYAKHHSKTFTPPSVPGYDKQITIFLSSQDEFESLGKLWRSPFADNAEVVQQLCEAFPNYFFCVRFHPNQADITSDITSPFHKVEQLENTQIYYANDTANSYDLVRWSDVVVTFGSTIAVEACWMGKPSVILGPSFYDRLDVSYTPASTPELIELLRRSDLTARNAENAARFAVFALSDGEDFRYISFENGKMRPKDFRQRNLPLIRFARYFDNIATNAIKVMCSRGNSRKRPAA